jgi:YHS domain-containing protein/mono/diheme cytochrome c family protein
MKKHSVVWLAVLCSLVMLGVACGEKTTPVSDALKKELALGEKVFIDKQCGKCHSSSDGSAVPPEMRAPDLTSAFLANDTIFVKAHLQFIELSSMPPLDLTTEETNALTKYVATLHARSKTDPNLKNPDAACTVCGAPLKVSQAQAEGLQATFAGKTYYFDCVDCKRLFERDASWYVEHGFPVTP